MKQKLFTDTNHSPKRKFGFTLAEVLITLAIIGVVAAMTMPTLIQHFQKKSLETQTQRFYSMMSQAVKQYMADYGVDDLRNTPLACSSNPGTYEDSCDSSESINSIKNFVTKYLNIVKICEQDECFANEYATIDGSNDGLIQQSFDADLDFVLVDGNVVRMGYFNADSPINLTVDVNGKKGPNKVGYDLWTMSIFYDGTIDEGWLNPECKKNKELCFSSENIDKLRDIRFQECLSYAQYGGCFGHFLENNFKFDY